LGWPNKKAWEEHRDYHPTAVLETGYDILFFWVARMVLMSSYAIGEVPFKDVYLHGLVRDEQGRKMSKSLGNILDPLDLIPKYGTDAVRLSLLIGTTPGMDMRLSEEKIAGFRNFTNKLWNISRYILMTIGDAPKDAEVEPKTLADRWILSRMSKVAKSVTAKLERYEFSSAGEELRDFTWGDLADWYLEIAKVEKGKEAVLRHVLKTVLALWHPFMPFVTEYAWELAGFEGKLIVGAWPAPSGSDEVAEFEQVRALVTDMRRLRSEQGIEPAKQVEFAVVADAGTQKLIEGQAEVIRALVRASDLSCVPSVADGWATTVSGTSTVAVNTAGAVDLAKEKDKLSKELADTETYIASLATKLANTEFLSKAPVKVRETMERNYGEAQAKLVALKERLAKLA
jgi:valyl-tRNA synthetase